MSVISSVHNRKAVGQQLFSGDQMSQEEFHRLYSEAPENFRAELVKGTVFVSSPVGAIHGDSHPLPTALFVVYEGQTPGVRVGDNSTVILNGDSEVQPDLHLRILPDYGGQCKTSTDDYIIGAPELIVEIANTSAAIDLNVKRAEYAANGVKEYLVLLPRIDQLRWFDLRADKELSAADNILRINAFPGLWIDSSAVFRYDISIALATLQRGLDSPEHKQFVEQLAARKSPPK
jgi:Uma2 family endonuclease